jgi:ParB/RepB/Spo0J family partition protein
VIDDAQDVPAAHEPGPAPVKGKRPPPPKRHLPDDRAEAAAALPAAAGRFEPAIPLDAIAPSPFNRKVRHVDDLVDSIRAQGVIQPITVRPTETIGGLVRFELVAGERRWRASEKAGRETIPAIVRELTDDQVVEVQLIENVKRQDLHPLEEADTYARLLALPGYTEERVAERTGTKLSHVRERLRLTRLTAAVRELFAAGKLGLEVALLIGRMPAVAELQDQAAKEIAKGKQVHAYDEDSGKHIDEQRPLTIREAQALLRSNYMTRLDRATWHLDDVQLVPAAGACSACPKRTGNQAALFPEIKSPDVCTDPTCFRGKTDAQFKRAADEAKDRGLKVLPDKEAKKVLSGYVDHERGVTGVAYDSKLVDVADKLPYDVSRNTDSKKTWSSVLKGVPDAPPVVIAKDPNTGAVRELVDKDAAIAAAKKAGKLKVERREPSPGSTAAHDKARKKEREKEKAAEQLHKAARARLLADVACGKPPAAKAELAWWRLLARLVASTTQYTGCWLAAERRGLSTSRYDNHVPKIEKEVGRLSCVDDLRGLALELLVGDMLEDGTGATKEDEKLIDELCKVVGIDRKAHLEAAKKALAAEAKVPPAKAGKKGGRRG